MSWVGFGVQKLRFSITLAMLLVTSSIAHTMEHTDNGTSYGEEGIQVYAQMKHGPDGTLFLDPYFLPYLRNLQGQTLLDAGCGAGPWSIFAAKNGAVVYGIDIQEGMIEKARQAALENQCADCTTFEVGDVGQVPYPNDFFDRAMSINVGCNLPSLKSHIRELSRVLKRGGVAIITAPTSFGTVFSDGKKPYEKMVSVINQLTFTDQESFPKAIQGLDDVYRATFAKKQNIWSLVLDEALLESGEEIWRKIPLMVVPNHYHCENEYRSLFAEEGFFIKEIYHPHFSDEQERQNYNQNQKFTLSKEYVTDSPFVIFIIEKSHQL